MEQPNAFLRTYEFITSW